MQVQFWLYQMLLCGFWEITGSFCGLAFVVPTELVKLISLLPGDKLENKAEACKASSSRWTWIF